MSEEEKFVIHQVPQAVLDHLLPDDIDPRIELRPMTMLPLEPVGKPLFISTPSGRDDFAYRYFSGANVGKSEPTWKLLSNMVALNHVAIGNGAHTFRDELLYGEFPHPQIEKPEFGEVFFPTVHLDPWMVHGHLGETQSWFERWMDGFSVGYYGFGSSRLRDKREWLGDSRLHHTECLSSIDSFRRGVLRVRIPARRYAGLNAYELPKLYYLEEKKPLDTYSHWIVRHVTGMDYYWEREKWFHSLIQRGLDAAFKVAKKPIAQRMSARPKLKR